MKHLLFRRCLLALAPMGLAGFSPAQEAEAEAEAAAAAGGGLRWRHVQVAGSQGIAVALALYTKDHDTHPESLADLLPHYLGEIPIDPFVGTPFEYELTDDGYRLTAAEQAHKAWPFDTDPALDWSRPLPDRKPPAPEQDESEKP